MKLVIAWRLSLNPPHKQVNKSVSLSIVPLFILSQSPEWREARERRENDGKYPCAPPVLPPSLVQYVPNEHVTSRTHFILFNWSSHPSWGDPICGAFNLRGPLIITVAHTHTLALHVQFSSKNGEREGRPFQRMDLKLKMMRCSAKCDAFQSF